MPPSIKDFSDLKPLRKAIKEQAEARKAAVVESRQREQANQREADLFRRSIGTVAPLAQADKHITLPPKPLPLVRQRPEEEVPAASDTLSDEFTMASLFDSGEALSFSRDGIGPDVLRKLRRSHWMIQAQLDLHGMRTDAARSALVTFLHDATQRGLRCVRVIHGKGLGSINQEPVLKNKVRNWLVQKEEVLAFCQAKAVDGGAGALVVLLKAQS